MSHHTNKTFCVLPWIHSFVNSNGLYQVCCTAEEYHDAILKDDLSPFSITDRPSMNEVMNSRFMKDLRIKLLSGEGSSICTRCTETEKHGGISRRILENNQLEAEVKSLIETTSQDGSIPISIQSVDYRLGNQCNLQCRMCSPFSSNKWIEDWNYIMPASDHLDQTKIDYYNGFTWFEGDLFLDEFSSKLKNIKRLHFAGGEPLLSKNMVHLLLRCIELKVSNQIILSYNTNITVLPKQVLDCWKSFKEVRLLCSIDGFDKVNDYIRHPSKWKQIDLNLKYLDENCKLFNIREILISTTVQLYNILTLNDLYIYVSKFTNILPALNLINLTFPHCLSTQVLPRSAKIESTENLLAIKKELEGKLSTNYIFLSDNIDQIIKFMNEKDNSDLLYKFKTFNRKYDQLKKTKLSESLPELYKHLMNYYLMKAEQVI